MKTLHTHPLTPSLKELALPVTIAVGSADFIGPGGSVIMHRQISGSELLIVEGRGHNLHLEDPPGFHRIVLRGLGRALPDGLG